MTNKCFARTHRILRSGIEKYSRCNLIENIKVYNKFTDYLDDK